MNRDHDGIRLIVRSADHGPRLIGYALTLWGWTGSDEVMGDGPRIVAINNAGKKYIIQQFTSLKKSKKALEPMQVELHRMGRSAWFDAHDVPSDFDTWGEDEPA